MKMKKMKRRRRVTKQTAPRPTIQVFRLPWSQIKEIPAALAESAAMTQVKVM